MVLSSCPACWTSDCDSRWTTIGGPGHEQHGKRGVVPVVLLGGEEEHAELGAIQPASVGGVNPGDGGRTGRGSNGCVRRCARTGRSHRPVESRRSIVDAASPRSSIQARNTSMCPRLASSTATPLSAAHWKKPRRSWRYASSLPPPLRGKNKDHQRRAR